MTCYYSNLLGFGSSFNRWDGIHWRNLYVMFLSMLPDLDNLPQFSIQTISRIFHNALPNFSTIIRLFLFPISLLQYDSWNLSLIFYLFTLAAGTFKQYSNKKIFRLPSSLYRRQRKLKAVWCSHVKFISISI